jgi:hypothetical protein
VSRYFYVNGDPINLIDPTGHDSVSGAGWDAGYYAALQQSGQQLTPSEQVAQQHAQAISDWEDAQRGEANIRSNRHLYTLEQTDEGSFGLEDRVRLGKPLIEGVGNYLIVGDRRGREFRDRQQTRQARFFGSSGIDVGAGSRRRSRTAL